MVARPPTTTSSAPPAVTVVPDLAIESGPSGRGQLTRRKRQLRIQRREKPRALVITWRRSPPGRGGRQDRSACCRNRRRHGRRATWSSRGARVANRQEPPRRWSGTFEPRGHHWLKGVDDEWSCSPSPPCPTDVGRPHPARATVITLSRRRGEGRAGASRCAATGRSSDTVMYAVRRSAPPKQMLVVIGSPVGERGRPTSPSGEIDGDAAVHERGHADVAVAVDRQRVESCKPARPAQQRRRRSGPSGVGDLARHRSRRSTPTPGRCASRRRRAGRRRATGRRRSARRAGR